jgi:hypothetical protein
MRPFSKKSEAMQQALFEGLEIETFVPEAR